MSYKNLKSSTQTFSSRIREITNNSKNTAGGFLSKLLLDVLEKRISVKFGQVESDRTAFERWNTLLISFLKDPKNAVPQNKESITAARGNLTKELLKGEMSWKVFIKGMRFMQITKIDFNINFHVQDGRVINHQSTMNLGEAYIDSEAGELPSDKESE